MRDGAIALTPSEHLARLAARTLGALPPAAQLRLSGRDPIRIDGLTLEPETQLMLALLARRGDLEPGALTPDELRRERRRMAVVFAGTPEAVGAVADRELPTEPRLRARHYAPLEASDAGPLLVYFHGGGFSFGDLDTHDGVCRMLCRHSGAHVLAIDYRLAPEHPFPAAVDDAWAALRWAIEHASELGADPGRIGVAGDSAGGNLAAVVAQLAARDGQLAPILQLLIYPAVDFTRRRRSRELFSDGFFLTQAQMDWFESNYLGSVGNANGHDPRASPLLAPDLSGLAPAIVVTAGFDPLRDEGEEYAEALRAAGTPVVLRRFASFIHGFTGAAGVSRTCRDAVVEIAGATRAMLAGSGATERSPDASAAAPASSAR